VDAADVDRAGAGGDRLSAGHGGGRQADPSISQTASVNFDEVKVTFPDRIALTNDGQATAHPEISVDWTLQRTDDTADVGWKYRRSITITNNGSQPLDARPWRISLGSTTALVSGS
jgi:hypothetical protein